MNKIVKILSLSLALVVLTTVAFADGKTSVNKITKDEAVEILKAEGQKTEKQLAKEAQLSEKEFKLIKAKDLVEVKPEEYIDLRSRGCMLCGQGRMINQGNKCMEENTTGNQRKCIHRYAYGVDIEIKKSCQATAVCDSCGHSVTTNWTETSCECHGFTK